MKYYFYIAIILFNFSIVNYSFTQDLTKQFPIEKIINFKGSVGDLHYYQPSELLFNTGKLYKLILKNISDSKHYFSSSEFSKAIFTRKVQVKFGDNKIAEVKGVINEIEVWPNYQLEWWFIPIKTGIFKDLFCKVVDLETGLSHSDMGMQGTIIIK